MVWLRIVILVGILAIILLSLGSPRRKSTRFIIDDSAGPPPQLYPKENKE